MISRSHPSSHRALRLLVILSGLLVLAAVIGSPPLPRQASQPLPSPSMVPTAPISMQEMSPATWQPQNDGLPGYTFITCIVTLTGADGAQVLLASVYGPLSLYRSEDGGASWRVSDSGMAGVGVFTLAAHPAQPGVVYAGTVSGVFHSSDYGASWQQMATPDTPAYALFIDPQEPDVIHAGSLGALWRSQDGGKRWAINQAGLEAVSVLSLTYGSDRQTLYAGTNGGGIMSSHDGSSWSSVHPTTTVVSVVAADPFSPQHLLARAQDTLLRSADGGATWTPAQTGHGHGLLGVVFDPRRQGAVYALTADQGVLGSDDSGATWRSLGLAGHAVYALALPASGPYQLLAGTVHGVWGMTAQQRWVQPGEPLGEPIVRSLVFSPQGELLAGTTDGIYRQHGQTWQRLGDDLASVQVLSLATSPGAAQRMAAGTWTHGVQVSDDGGLTWRQTTDQQFTNIIVPAVSIDPIDSSNVYARVEYARLLISRDAGETWSDSSLPITVTVFAIAIAPDDSSRLYVGTDRGIYRSLDYGEHWQALAGPPGANSVMALALDPTDADAIYAGSETGLHYSRDGGQTWKQAVGLDDTTVTTLAMHPTDRYTMYAGTRYHGAFASSDGGVTWGHMGLNASVNVLAITPDAQTLCAGTEDGVYTLRPLALAPIDRPRQAAPSATPPSAHQSAGSVGLAVHTLHADGALVSLAQAAGFSALVQVLPWRDVEPEKGQFSWESADALVRAAEFYGLDLVLRIDFQPLWARDTWVNAPPRRLEDYGDFVHAVAMRYRGRVQAYIIWNEPNLALEWGGERPDAQRYSALLKIAYQSIKKADSRALVVSAGLAPTNEQNEQAQDDRIYLRAMYAAGAKEYFDVLGAHPYGFGQPPDDPRGAHDGLNVARLEDLRELMIANGDADKPVWITEFGWTTEAADAMHGGHVVSETEQADYLVRACQKFLHDWPWVRFIAVWNMSAGLPLNDQMRGYSIINDDYSAKPAYIALQAMRRTQTRGAATPETQPQETAIAILAADVAVHLGDQDYLVWPWVHVHRRVVPATEWCGEFFVRSPGNDDWILALDGFQLNEWGNHIQINGQPLDPPFLPGRVNDWAGYWTRVHFSVPAAILRAGVNTLTIRSSMNAPVHQAHAVSWEDLQFRNIVLRAQPAR